MAERIFNVFYVVSVAAVCAVLAGPVRANDGCESEVNDRITPELALCSVHAYNIGLVKNPSGADKQLMKDVVALKTTVITQQMNKQYEYMDAMIRRFKTQLEKAVLTTKLQAAGAAPSASDASGNGGGSYGTTGGGAGRKKDTLAGAEDCMYASNTPTDAMQCLLRNNSKMQSAVSGGDLNAVRRQLEADLNVFAIYNELDKGDDCSTITTENDKGKRGACMSVSSANRTTITTCLSAFRGCVIKNNAKIQQINNAKK